MFDIIRANFSKRFINFSIILLNYYYLISKKNNNLLQSQDNQNLTYHKYSKKIRHIFLNIFYLLLLHIYLSPNYHILLLYDY